MTIHPKRACPACGDDSHLYRKADEIWNPASEEWEFSGTEGAVECTTCDWSGTEDETEGPLCQGCGKPEAACSANPCAAVAADRGDQASALNEQVMEALRLSVMVMRVVSRGICARSLETREVVSVGKALDAAEAAIAAARVPA